MSVWYNYSRVMGIVPVETRGLMVMNLVLLFVVAFHGADAVGEAASVLYGIDLAVMNALLGGFVHILSREDKALMPASLLNRMRTIRDVNFGFATVFLVSIFPVFWTRAWPPGVPIRFLIWILTLPAGWTIRLMRR